MSGDLTAAIEAAAREEYRRNVAPRWRNAPGWEELAPIVRHAYLEAVSPIVAAAVAALHPPVKASDPGPRDTDCPHASPHRYCARCPVSPCPLGLDQPDPRT